MHLKHRKGRIKFSRELNETLEAKDLSIIFGNFFPFFVVDEPTNIYVEYYGRSEQFYEIIEGQEIPEYAATIDSIKRTIEFERSGS